MELSYKIVTSIFLIAFALPFTPSTHWFFRGFDFAKVHIFFVQCILLLLGIFFWHTNDNTILILQLLNVACVVYNAILLSKYTGLYKREKIQTQAYKSKPIKVLSFNVYQFNEEYDKFIDLVNQMNPDVILTMESDSKWDTHLQILKNTYPNFKEFPLDNTYGMHFYTRLQAKKIEGHFFIADDLPSVEAHLMSDDGFAFTFWGVHPPPPSPTEEPNSKERDGELMVIAHSVKENHGPNIIIGDFNNVSWAKSSRLLKRIGQLIDPRIGRGLIATFHAKYKLLRFPIDQVFHTPDIQTLEMKTMPYIGSDHFPLYLEFEMYNKELPALKEELIASTPEDIKESVDMIIEGKNEQSDRDEVVEDDSIF